MQLQTPCPDRGPCISVRNKRFKLQHLPSCKNGATVRKKHEKLLESEHSSKQINLVCDT